MARKRQRTHPGGAIVAWIDNQRRIDVDREAIFSALNLAIRPGQAIHIWGVAGPQQQVQLLPVDSELAKLRDRANDRTNQTIAWDSSRSADVVTYRQMAASLKITCRLRKSGKTARLTLPFEAVDLGYFKVGEPLVLFFVGNVVELWPRDRWRDANLIQDFKDLVRRTRRALSSTPSSK